MSEVFYPNDVIYVDQPDGFRHTKGIVISCENGIVKGKEFELYGSGFVGNFQAPAHLVQLVHRPVADATSQKVLTGRPLTDDEKAFLGGLWLYYPRYVRYMNSGDEAWDTIYGRYGQLWEDEGFAELNPSALPDNGNPFEIRLTEYGAKTWQEWTDAAKATAREREINPDYNPRKALESTRAYVQKIGSELTDVKLELEVTKDQLTAACVERDRYQVALEQALQEIESFDATLDNKQGKIQDMARRVVAIKHLIRAALSKENER